MSIAFPRSLARSHRAALCPHFAVCGGCDTQDIPYDEQLRLKDVWLRQLFSPLSAEDFWLPFTASSEGYPVGYRGKIRFGFIEVEGQLRLSRHARQGNEDIPIDVCYLPSGRALQIAHATAEFANTHSWGLFEPGLANGWLKHIIVREGFRTGQLLVSLVTTEHQIPQQEAWIDHIRQVAPGIASIYQTQTHGQNNEMLQDTHLWGEVVIEEQVGAYIFAISPHAFFQTNAQMVKTLYDIVREACPRLTTLWDLYAGSATLGCYLHDRAEQVISIESNLQNITDAQRNLSINQITNLEIAAGTVEEVVNQEFLDSHHSPDCIVVDPPRAGLSAQVRNLLVDRAPHTLIYVSCNPITCLRDCQDLTARGYRLVSGQGIDMFPHTVHAELVIRLEKA